MSTPDPDDLWYRREPEDEEVELCRHDRPLGNCDECSDTEAEKAAEIVSGWAEVEVPLASNH